MTAANGRTLVRLASGAGPTFGVDDIAVAWATSGLFWQEEGLEVSWTPVRGGVKAAEAVLSGEVDGAYGTWVPVAKMVTEAKPLRILASMAQALAQNLVVNSGRIRSPADLRGKKWAVDGIGALSHTLGLLIARGLGIPEAEIDWVVAGPPPQRIDQLMDGRADCSLIRVEEAAALARDHPERLSRLLGSEEIAALAPVQPHGVISVSEDFARNRPEVCEALVRGLVRASRSLHDRFENFVDAVDDHVRAKGRSTATGRRPRVIDSCRVQVSDAELEAIWKCETGHGSFAVNGGMTRVHWAKNLKVFADVYPATKAPALDDIAFPRFVESAVEGLGVHPAPHDKPEGTRLEACGPAEVRSQAWGRSGRSLGCCPWCR